MNAERLLLLSRKLLFADDFSSYADDAAVQAVYVPGGTTPLVTLLSAPRRMRVEGGAAAIAYGARSFVTVPNRQCLLTGVIIAKGSNTPRILIGTSANNSGLGLYQATVLGAFSISFTPTGASTFVTVSTNSTTLGTFVEVNDLRMYG